MKKHTFSLSHTRNLPVSTFWMDEPRGVWAIKSAWAMERAGKSPLSWLASFWFGRYDAHTSTMSFVPASW